MFGGLLDALFFSILDLPCRDLLKILAGLDLENPGHSNDSSFRENVCLLQDFYLHIGSKTWGLSFDERNQK